MRFAFDPNLAARIEASGLIAVVVIDRAEDAVPLANALLEGGINVMELTLRTDAAIPALREIRRHVPEMVVGVGTIIRPKQVPLVRSADAAFGVSPGVNPAVISAAWEAGLPFAPGISTPSDIEASMPYECHLLKFFPAESLGGLKYLQAITSPYMHLGLKFIPLGGIDENNMEEYLSSPLVSALGGSWIAPRDAIRAGDWAGITARAASARNRFNEIRGNK